jgi:lauroyl/myristoyl acyltransferase
VRRLGSPLRRFAVRGVVWREYLDWAILNTPFYMHFVMILFWTFFFFFFAAPARRALVANLAIVLPGSSRAVNHLRALRTLYNFAWSITDAAAYRLAEATFSFEVIGAEFLEQLAAARGAIVLTAHMGSYDLGAALFAQKFNRQLRMVRAPEPDEQSEQHLRSAVGEAGEGAVKIDYNTAGALLSFDLLGALRNGEIVSIQGDRANGNVGYAEAMLFGKTVRVPNGPFVLARAAGAPIFPLFLARTAYRKYAVIVRQPICLARTASDTRDDIAAAVAEWSRTLEQVVAQYWCEWFAFEPVFPTNGAA